MVKSADAPTRTIIALDATRVDTMKRLADSRYPFRDVRIDIDSPTKRGALKSVWTAVDPDCSLTPGPVAHAPFSDAPSQRTPIRRSDSRSKTFDQGSKQDGSSWQAGTSSPVNPARRQPPAQPLASAASDADEVDHTSAPHDAATPSAATVCGSQDRQLAWHRAPVGLSYTSIAGRPRWGPAPSSACQAMSAWCRLLAGDSRAGSPQLLVPLLLGEAADARMYGSSYVGGGGGRPQALASSAGASIARLQDALTEVLGRNERLTQRNAELTATLQLQQGQLVAQEAALHNLRDGNLKEEQQQLQQELERLQQQVTMEGSAQARWRRELEDRHAAAMAVVQVR